MIKRIKWTDNEIESLRKMKSEKTNLELSRLFGCSKHQIVYAMKVHRIRRTKVEINALWEKWEPIHRKLLNGSFNKQKHSARSVGNKCEDKDSSVELDDLFRQLYED